VTNRFEVVSVTYASGLHLRLSGEVIPGIDDSDFVARVIGRCAAGPDVGRRVYSFHVVSKELKADSTVCERFVRAAALQSWKGLRW